ncbi:MAG: PLP-dependent aminotransferase family protein [Sutterellaceae bacterium]|nr:PLP-dependent aminotransferase family protein [Sutterellaceae bacterium]MDD7442751.1 PLP-dependent aminotransferase family protein [Sutterellaceae bacterium]MDY2867289.1 PLP-dependent aminotransferase family protein [Mesosutterella sp.]
MSDTNTLRPAWSSMAAGLPEDVLGPILANGTKPGIISFGGGLPSPEGFPTKELERAAEWCLEAMPKRALQYSDPQGEPELRAEIAKYENGRGNPTDPDNVAVVTGSQQALDLAARIFVNPGDAIMVQRPTYVGALEAFNLSQPRYVEMPEDEEGTAPALIGDEADGVKFAYILATFSNPTGRTMTVERRKQLIEKAREHRFWIVEDDPYGELWYHRKPPVSIQSLAPDCTIRFCSFSKVLAPGMRLGYITGPKEVIRMFAKAQSYAVLSTPCITQLMAAKVMADGLFSYHLDDIRRIYRAHAEAMLAALDEFMPKHPGISWTHPEGGMFIWLTLPEGIDTMKLLPEAIEQGLLYVPGSTFYGNSPESHQMRLSFVTVSEEKIREGVKRLAALISSKL